jgi:hypothetical protein
LGVHLLWHKLTINLDGDGLCIEIQLTEKFGNRSALGYLGCLAIQGYL